MNNIVRTWEDEENLAAEIELTDIELAGVYGAGGEEEEDDDHKKHAKPCVEMFIKQATININCEEMRHKEKEGD